MCRIVKVGIVEVECDIGLLNEIRVSNYLNVTDYNWLRELIQSPEVYFEQGGYYYPIVTMTSNWEEKKRIADKMFNLELDVQIANKKYSQFR